MKQDAIMQQSKRFQFGSSGVLDMRDNSEFYQAILMHFCNKIADFSSFLDGYRLF
jgi:hypothetical protein